MGTNGSVLGFPPRPISYSCIEMNGKEVFRFACRCVPQSIESALGKAGLSGSNIDWLLLHQVSLSTNCESWKLNKLSVIKSSQGFDIRRENAFGCQLSIFRLLFPCRRCIESFLNADAFYFLPWKNVSSLQVPIFNLWKHRKEKEPDFTFWSCIFVMRGMDRTGYYSPSMRSQGDLGLTNKTSYAPLFSSLEQTTGAWKHVLFSE